ncbi:hypothetical protein F0M18_10785 [Pseudohalioglobus sediminis]|uniref:Uncharacterized protein n=1 Tax=Pseudohalioglobus sediminis TaxID=2606449 RepID=A0A5B0X0A1_9GAMM|nr:hypothetical protein [Pseudohalioglobus sediminis]KAA1191997.1 hypothetical protein F0M18_10785 [Pseudohalioglobus sediminis]
MNDSVNSTEAAFAELSQRPGFLLAKQAGIHLAVWLLSFSLFAATDSWTELTGSSLASLLNMLTGIVAGFVTVNLVHEWFHYLGAKLTSGQYAIAARPGLFVFDWHFDKNSLGRFYVMSIAGSVGGALGVWYLFANISPDNSGRAALLAAGVAGFVLGSLIEWPVLLRTRRSRDPLAELSKLTPPVLGRAIAGSAITGVLCWMALT